MTHANEIMLVINIVFMLINITWLAFQSKHNKDIVNQEEEVKDEFIPQECSFNFIDFKVIGIERYPSYNDPYKLEYTLITYYDINSEYEEFYIYCSIENHNKLVKEFNKYKGLKNV